MAEIKLPKEKRKPVAIDPKTLILFGKPKQGKTTAVSMLDDCLLIDINKGGSDYVSGLILKAGTIQELKAIETAIRTAGNPYKRIAIDTASDLEELVAPLAEYAYKQTSMGKNWNLDPNNKQDLRSLPQGAGYFYLRQAFMEVLDWFRPLCDQLIILAHCNDKLINENGEDLSQMEMDLTGKLKRIVSANSDALGYVYRSGNKTVVSFKGGEDAIVEARSPHLKGKIITLLESDDDGNLTSHWDEIFIEK